MPPVPETLREPVPVVRPSEVRGKLTKRDRESHDPRSAHMRLTSIFVVSGVAVGLLAVPAAAADGTTTKTGPLPLVKDLALAGCEFPVLMTDRGGRTLTTTYDGETVVRQVITGSSDVELRNAVSGAKLVFTIKERAVYDIAADGTTTLTQTGVSGLAIDSGTVTGSRNLTWYAGRARTVGRLDPAEKIPLLATVDEQSVSGLGGDVCEMLLTGLKSRH